MEDVNKRVDSSGAKGSDGGGNEEIFDKVGNKRSYLEDNDQKSASPEHKNLSITKQEEAATSKERYNMGDDSRVSSSNQKEQNEKLESARAEMGEVREENERLKMYLDQIMKDYRTLQTQFNNIFQKEERNKSTSQSKNNEPFEESELVSLSLGRFSSETKDQKEENLGEKLLPQSSRLVKENDHDHEQDSKGLSLGLDCKFETAKSSTTELPFAESNASPMNSSAEVKEEAGETWPPSKALKTARSGDDEVLQQNPVKKARVSVRARCDTPTMNDGCQWRKYGQKIAKGNPCPRAYYRCTVAQSCPVRKQVQRCPEDLSILVTTYEGTHNHPLPISATAMASTTSAAASMLLSGSTSTSRTSPSSSTTVAAANFHGLNFYLSDNSNSRPFYLHNSSSLLSPSPSHPTITLDLTSAPNSSSLFNRFSSSTYPPIPKFSSTSLSFSTSSESNWAGNSFFTYGSGDASANSATSQLPFIRNQLGNINQARSDNILNYQSYIQRNNNVVSAPPTQQQQMSVLPDTIAAATKAITADPSFQSALAAALQSIIGAGNSSNAISGGEGHVQKVMKWGDQSHHFPVMMSSNYSSGSSSNGNACATSYLNRTTSTSSHQGSGSGGSLKFLPPSSLPISSPASTSTSPGDDGEP